MVRPLRSTFGSGRLRIAFGGAALAISLFAAPASSRAAAPTLPNLRAWGIETYNEIDRTLRVPGTRLFAETASLDGTRSGGVSNRSFVWPASTQFRVFNTLTQIDSATYGSLTKQFSDQLKTSYWSSSSTVANTGYRSSVPSGAGKFYDDNAHIAFALAEAYRITKDTTYLDRAKETYAFVRSGEDTAGGGGIYFQQGNTSSKDSVATLQGARTAAMLYKATGQSSYLTDAQRLMSWANSHVQLSNGLYSQGYVIATSSPGGVDIVNAAGVGISANIELYDATGNKAYLTEAQRVATASLGRFFNASNGSIGDEGYWAFELVDALDNLYMHDKNASWLLKTTAALGWLHDNKQDPNGHYGLFWGRNGPETSTLSSWNLNEQASVARAYLYTGAVPEPTTLATLAAVGLIALRRRR